LNYASNLTGYIPGNRIAAVTGNLTPGAPPTRLHGTEYMSTKTPAPKPAIHSGYAFPLVLLFALLTVLFWRSFLPDYVHFSNDGPLGQENVNWGKLPAAWTGMWDDLNATGYNTGIYTPSFSALLLWLLTPLGFVKFYPAVALLLLGVGAWTFFRALKFSPLAVTLGMLATVFNSTFFADACWGTASHQIALGMDFFALALVIANTAETSHSVRWSRLALAGLCVGVNVMEAADIGAFYSILIAAYVFFRSVVNPDGRLWRRIFHGAGQVVIIAIFAAVIAGQTIAGLVSTQITGIAGTGQDAEAKAAHWDYATEWSFPKRETLEMVVPGLFGYKMDTPGGMMPAFQDLYRNGAYWGGVGRDPAIDRYLDGTGPATQSPTMRFSDGAYYCGLFVFLIASWTIAQSFRRQNSPFTGVQKKLIWFWAVVMVATLLLSWGRFAPMFYGLLYQLPYFSTIRNPTKFLFLFSMALVMLFAEGVHALSSRYVAGSTAKPAKLGDFDRKWLWACLGVLGASILGWIVYATKEPALVDYLQKVGFGGTDPAQDNTAAAIAAFSVRQVGWFVLLFAIALGLLALSLAGYFSGRRAKWGAALLGTFLIFDLVRANLPYVVHWNYKQKYEVGSLNPIVEFLDNQPYEHRVTMLPFGVRQQLRGYDYLFGGQRGLYGIEWTQHLFPYYNIQCLDLIQMARMPEDMMAYQENFFPHSDAEVPLYTRHWQLTNTRYLLGPAGFLDVLNQQLDPGQNRFRIVQRFDLTGKPGIVQMSQLGDLTAIPVADGELALFEFTGALPRLKLYSSWQVNTNDNDVLKTLADLAFDPTKSVLVDTPESDLATNATGTDAGSADFKSYAPESITVDATAAAPSVLLLNDRYDPHWHVTVDGQPAQLLRCNYLMQGVYLTPGTHTIGFAFRLPNKASYLTLSALGAGLVLGIFLWVQSRIRTPH
jgi:hypothetical protein